MKVKTTRCMHRIQSLLLNKSRLQSAQSSNTCTSSQIRLKRSLQIGITSQRYLVKCVP